MTDNALLKLEILGAGSIFILPQYPKYSIYRDPKGWTTNLHIYYFPSLVELVIWLEGEYG